MAINFRKIAEEGLSISPLMVGRRQIKTEELIGQTITIKEFDFANIIERGEQKTYPVLLLDEYPDRYYNGGALLNKICEAWAAAADGDIESASAELRQYGGVKFKVSATKTKSGNNLTSIDLV